VPQALGHESTTLRGSFALKAYETTFAGRWPSHQHALFTKNNAHSAGLEARTLSSLWHYQVALQKKSTTGKSALQPTAILAQPQTRRRSGCPCKPTGSRSSSVFKNSATTGGRRFSLCLTIYTTLCGAESRVFGETRSSTFWAGTVFLARVILSIVLGCRVFTEGRDPTPTLSIRVFNEKIPCLIPDDPCFQRGTPVFLTRLYRVISGAKSCFRR